MHQPTDSSKESRSAKRTRGYLACTSCRKQKARCELLGPELSILCCRRCHNLKIECSFMSQPRPVTQLLSSTTSDTATSGTTPDARFSSLGPPLAPDGTRKRTAVKFSNPSGRLWSFITPSLDDPEDWAAPVFAIQGLLNRVSIPKSPTQSYVGTSLRSILPEGDIQELLSLFQRIHKLWLHFSPKTFPNSSLDMLDAARCLVALRYLTTEKQQLYSHRLNAYCQSSISATLFNPPTAEDQLLELIQALIILGTWSYIDPTQSRGGIPESRTLFAAAVGFAMDLRLNQLSTLYQDLDKQNQASLQVAEVMRWKISLWIALSVQESTSCAGKGKMPVSRRSTMDSEFFLKSPPAAVDSPHETHLRFLCELYDLTERMVSLKYETCQYEGMLESMTDFKTKLDQKQSFIEQLAAVTDGNGTPFYTLRLQCLLCKLCGMYQASFELVHGVQRAMSMVPSLKHQGANFPAPFDDEKLSPLKQTGFETYTLCQTVVTSFVSLWDIPALDHDCLMSLPDVLFVQISLAALKIIALRWIVKRNRNLDVPGYTGPLLNRLVQRLYQCAGCAKAPPNPSQPSETCRIHLPDHPAAKCARLLKRCLDAWDEFLVVYREATDKGEEPPNFRVPLDTPDIIHSVSAPSPPSSLPETEWYSAPAFLGHPPSSAPQDTSGLYPSFSPLDQETQRTHAAMADAMPAWMSPFGFGNSPGVGGAPVTPPDILQPAPQQPHHLFFSVL